MKILFVPMDGGGHPHLIPLLALKQMAEKKGHETAFLLSADDKDDYRAYFGQFGMNVLDIDHTGTVATEIKAYELYQPDLVIDDFSLSTGYACKLLPTARIAIQRTGMFQGDAALSGYTHSAKVDQFPEVAMFGLEKFKTLPEFFEADVRIVPGIPSLEFPPDRTENPERYYFSGPLILADLYVSQKLVRFFKRNEARKKIYLTYGSMQAPPMPIHQCIGYMLEEGMAVVTNVPSPELEERYPDTFCYEVYFPMHYVCAKTDLIIHHCGSATYHYPIMHGKPSITLCTQAYDRELVARRLHNLGISRHLQHPDAVQDFFGCFTAALHDGLSSNHDMAIGRDRLLELKEEIRHTCLAFDIQQVAEQAMALFRKKLNNLTPVQG